MKKFYLSLMVVILMLGAMLTGCSSNASQDNITGNTCADAGTCSLDGGADNERTRVPHFYSKNNILNKFINKSSEV